MHRFFGFSEGSLVNLNEVMPSYIGEIHTNLIENYLVRGYSQRIGASFPAFALSSQLFLIPVNIFLSSTQLYPNDFVLNAAFVKHRPDSQYFILHPATARIKGITESLFRIIFSREKGGEEKSQVSSY